MKQSVLLSLTLSLAAVSGCTMLGGSPDNRPIRTIDWQDPVSVVTGFYQAKKRGDWKTAYRCCDYEEILPREERAKIKKQWKAESPRWPIDYRHTFTNAIGIAFEDDIALVRVLVARRDPITHKLTPEETYRERLKKFKGEWKIISLFPTEDTRRDGRDSTSPLSQLSKGGGSPPQTIDFARGP